MKRGYFTDEYIKSNLTYGIITTSTVDIRFDIRSHSVQGDIVINKPIVLFLATRLRYWDISAIYAISTALVMSIEHKVKPVFWAIWVSVRVVSSSRLA